MNNQDKNMSDSNFNKRKKLSLQEKATAYMNISIFQFFRVASLINL